MRISDWSSDVCSSDLPSSEVPAVARLAGVQPRADPLGGAGQLRGAARREGPGGGLAVAVACRAGALAWLDGALQLDALRPAAGLAARRPAALERRAGAGAEGEAGPAGGRPMRGRVKGGAPARAPACGADNTAVGAAGVGMISIVLATHRSEEHTSELQSLMRISYAVFCLKKKTKQKTNSQVNKQKYVRKRRRRQTSEHIQRCKRHKKKHTNDTHYENKHELNITKHQQKQNNHHKHNNTNI